MTLPLKPKLHRSYYQIPSSSREVVQFHNEEKALILTGKSVSTLNRLLPLLDGFHTIPQICRKLRNVRNNEIISILTRLHETGLIEDGRISLSPPKAKLRRYADQITFFSQFMAAPMEAQLNLKKVRVVLINLGPIGGAILSYLSKSGIGNILAIDGKPLDNNDMNLQDIFSEADLGKPRAMAVRKELLNPDIRYEGRALRITSNMDTSRILDIIGKPDMVIVACDSPDPLLCEIVNDACLESDVTWTSCSLVGRRAYVGPTIKPHETACYKCFELRRDANVSDYALYEQFHDFLRANRSNRRPYGKLVPFPYVASSLVTCEVLSILSGVLPAVTFNNVLVFDFSRLRLTQHPVLRLPRCPSCGVSSRNSSLSSLS